MAELNKSHDFWAFANEAKYMLTPEAISGTFQGLQGLYAPQLNAMMQSQALAGQMGAQSIQANLSRAGLGQTGLGAALGAGLQAGAAFQGNQLRARMMSDLLGQSIGVNQARMGLLGNLAMGELQAGVQAMGMPSGFDKFMGYLGSGVQAAGSLMQGYGMLGGGPPTPPPMAM